MPTAPPPNGPASGLATGTGWPTSLAVLRGTAGGAAAIRLPARTPATALGCGAGERAGAWLRAAAAGLVLLAGAAAAVSFSAQYRMTDAARRLPVIAGLEAAIPDAAALVFACLGIAMALHGRRAVRARFLNLAAVGTSVFMNAIAAAPGWRGLAIWVMPPVAYALASDTLIGVVRAHAIARRDEGTARPAADDATPLAAAGQALLWLTRLIIAPASTLAGFRARVLAACPVPARDPGRGRHPGSLDADPRPTAGPRPGTTRPVASRTTRPPGHGPGVAQPGTKTARFLALAEREHGSLAAVPLASVGRVSAALAPIAGLHPGSARTALRRAILSARNGSPS